MARKSPKQSTVKKPAPKKLRSVPLINNIIDKGLLFLTWMFAVTALDALVVNRLYDLIAPDALGFASEHEITLRYVMYLVNAGLAALILPLVWTTKAGLKARSLQVALAAIPFAVVPLFIQNYDWVNTMPELHSSSDILMRTILIGLCLGALVKLLQLLRSGFNPSELVNKTLRPMLVPVLLIGAGLAAELTNNYSLTDSVVYTQFRPLFLHNQAGLALALSLLLFALLVSKVAKRYAAYAIVVLVVVFSGLNAFAARTAYSSTCERLVTNMVMLKASVPAELQGNVSKALLGGIRQNCDNFYYDRANSANMTYPATPEIKPTN